MSNVQFGSGMLFLTTPDGDSLMGEVEEFGFVESPTYAEDHKSDIFVKACGEFNISVNMSRQSITRLLQAMCGILDLAFDLCKDAGYGQIVHLAKHGRKKRVRKKNLHRVMRTLEKMAAREHGNALVP